MSEIAGIRPVERTVGPSPVEIAQPAALARRDPEVPERVGTGLDPAVTLDIGRDDASAAVERGAQAEYRGRYVKEPDSRQIVFQVIDPGTGTVMIQLPTPQAVEARTYAEAVAARAAEARIAAARGHPVDRTA